MTLKITILLNDKEYNYEFKDSGPNTIAEQIKRILKDLEKLNIWQQSPQKRNYKKS
jgi:hypothetical protein